MSESPLQAKGLVIEDSDPYFYELKIQPSRSFPPLTVKELKGEEWLYTVLACRERISEINPLIAHYKENLKKFDFVKGPIADDRMNEAIRAFEDGNLTDKGLLYCLSKVDYGEQIVAKSKIACASIKVITEREIYGQEADQTRIYTQEMRQEGRNAVKEAQRAFRNKGLYIDEVIVNLKQKEVDRDLNSHIDTNPERKLYDN